MERLWRSYNVCEEMILVQVPTSHGKADLTIYRDASARILKVLGERYPSITIERASIDEVYLDLTAEAKRLLASYQTSSQLLTSLMSTLQSLPTVIAGQDEKELRMTKDMIRNGHSAQGVQPVEGEEGQQGWFDRPGTAWTMDDLLLICGAELARQLRADVFDKLGFTCSAGIAHNKMLAKLGSGMHKPNKQTLVPHAMVALLIKDLPYTRIQGFGGKLGAQIAEHFGEHVQTLSDVREIPRAELVEVFGLETTDWIIQKAHGVDHEAVQDRALPISIGCSKSFRSTNILLPPHLSDGTVLKWLVELAGELTQRIEDDEAQHNRRARQLHLGFSLRFFEEGVSMKKVFSKEDNWWRGQGVSLSKVARMPPRPMPSSIASIALSLLQRALQENPRVQALKQKERTAWGITSLGLSATSFDKMEVGKRSIAAFLQPKSSSSSSDLSCQAFTSKESQATYSGQDNQSDGEEGEVSSSSVMQPLITSEGEDDEVTILSVGTADERKPSLETSNLLALAKRQLKDVDLDAFAELPPEIQQEMLQASFFQPFSTKDKAAAMPSQPRKKSRSGSQQHASSSKLTSWLAK
eukprot:scaffold2324_cov163-Ochromonas_danica.AAC.13